MRKKYNNSKEGKMNKKFLRTFKAVDFALILTMTMFLCLVSFAPALSNTSNNTDNGDTGILLMKVVVGYANKCNGEPASGGSVSVSSSLGSRSGTALGDGSWQVDISGSGPEDPDWPDGTSFSVSISHSDADGSFSGSRSGTVGGTVTNVGTVTLNPTTLAASAGGSPLSGVAPLTVSFNGDASGGCKPYTWGWNFDGDGTSSSQNPTHVFNTPGTYVCTLTATDDCSSQDTDSVTVTVNSALSCDAGGPYNGDTCSGVSFSGSASGGVPPYTYSWTFGDSSSGSGQNPSHQYTSDGSYTATLTVTDNSANTETDTASVSINTATLSANAGGPYSGDSCSAVSFSGSASGGCSPYTYSWSFSDGGSASGQNPSHQFASDGSYTATLTVTGDGGQTDTDTATISITTATLTCDAGGSYEGYTNTPLSFSASASGGCSPYTFTWSFSDGGSASGQSVSHSFSTEGSFTATVTVISSDGQSCVDTASVSIATNPPTANAHGPYEGVVNQNIRFWGSATGGSQPYTFTWDFGDGTSGSGETPTHSYDEIGNYFVTLTVVDDAGQSDTDSTSAIITSDDEPIADANGDYYGEVGEEIEFEGDVYGGTSPYSWLWEFGEGNTSDERNLVYVYEAVGEYMVNLTVTDDNGYSDTDEVLCTIVASNDPPLKPDTPSGETEGKFGNEYTYTTSTTDPDGDAVYYKWDWGDGSMSDWLGPFGNGAEASTSHTYERPEGSKSEAYEVKVKARDPSGEESVWSDPLPITMPHVWSYDLPVFIQRLCERFPFLGRIFFAIFF
ncbi:PKD domain-containing protein [Thermoplasmatota archaeon]